MAKRHTCLVELSRDHYHGLLLAVRLQQGDRALLKLWSHDPLWQSRYVVDFFEHELRFHFEAEEKVLFPPIRARIRAVEPIISSLISEHRALESKASALKKPDERTIRSDLKEFGSLLEGHIRTEDRTLFPLIEEQAPSSLLDEIDVEMKRLFASRPPSPFRSEETAP